jgi:hypothetical protein
MVLYLFNFVIVTGVMFLVFCLRRFAQDVRPSHTVKRAAIRKRTPIMLRPMKKPVELARRRRA